LNESNSRISRISTGYQPDIGAFRTPDIMSFHPLVAVVFTAIVEDDFRRFYVCFLASPACYLFTVVTSSGALMHLFFPCTVSLGLQPSAPSGDACHQQHRKRAHARRKLLSASTSFPRSSKHHNFSCRQLSFVFIRDFIY